MTIAERLEDVGFGQYAEKSVENDVDFDVLADLTIEDLKYLDVTKIDYRRKLLSAFAGLDEDVIETSVFSTYPHR